MRLSRVFLVLVVLAAILAGVVGCGSKTQTAAKSPEELWAELAGLSPAEREQRLVEGAKKEGAVVHYSSTQTELVEALQTAFQSRYPFMKPEFIRTTTSAEIDRILTEHRAGKTMVDVIFLPAYAMYLMIQEGVLGKYDSPERATMPASLKTDYTTAWMIEPEIVGYNVNLIGQENVPRTWDALLSLTAPFGRTANASPWVSAVLSVKGEEQGRKYLEAVAALKPRLYDSNTAVATALASGEITVGFDLHLGSLDAFIRKGAPVAFVEQQPPVLYCADIAVTKNAPHPHSAALLLDWMLSKEAQEILARHGWNGVRDDVAYPAAEIVKRAKSNPDTVVYNQALVGPKYSENQRLFDDLFFRK
ncbi:MAG: extracellular solute-binding protein [Anaerolineae bacterium]|nr:extracellular solute-binding protein [Anaerolineae bacterium]